MKSVVVSCFLLLLSVFASSAVRSQPTNPCDPLVPFNCLLPFPSDYYLREDNSTPTGYRVEMPDEASPVDRSGDHFSLQMFHRLDGFSPSTVMMTYFENLSLDNVPGWWDIAPSLDADCPTVLLDADTGERQPHFGELDHTTAATAQRAFMIWPTKMLEYGHTYIVAMRNLRNSTGPVSVSDAFRDLRDGTPSSDPDVEYRRDAYEWMFDTLERAGVERENLQIAWYFVVGSEEFNTRYVSYVQQDAKNYYDEATGPSYRIEEVTDDVNEDLARVIRGVMSVPHYLTRNALPGSELVLDENGDPVYQGMTEAEFLVHIPYSCVGKSCPVINYGHGLLGDKSEGGASVQRAYANDYGYVIVSVDMWGMCMFDVPSIVSMVLTDLGKSNIIPDRSVQGVLNHFLAIKLMKGAFANDPNVIFNGTSAIDPSRLFYWGISQGGILGCVVVAMSEDIQRGHLGVPGGPYPLLLARSVDFTPFFLMIKGRYENPIDRIMILSLLGAIWDRAEPGGFMNKLKEKDILIDYAKGDAQVSYLGAYFMGRSANAKLFPNNVDCVETTPLYGFEVATEPFTGGSAIVGYDFGIDCGPIENTPPPKETDTHSDPRRDIRNQNLAHHFFSTGELYDPCDGQGCYESVVH